MNKSSILDVNFHNLTLETAFEQVEQFIESKKFHYIVTPNPEFVVLAQKDKQFKHILNNADLSLPDGTGIILAAKFLHKKLNRIPGMDFILNLMPLAQEKNWRIFFLGGKDDVPEFAKKVLQNKYSNLQIVGAETGPFWHEDELKANEELKELVNKINNSQADILLVAFGAPKQEKFIDFFRNDLNVKVAIGVGGSLDYISGLVPRAPEWIRQVGLEWLYRLFKQPSRIKRIFTATIIFPILVLAKGRKNA